MELIFSTLLTGFTQGNCFVFFSSFFWSAYLIRVSRICHKFVEISLQSVKTMLLAIIYSVWWGVMINNINYSHNKLSWMTSLSAWVMLLYSFVGPGTLADIL